HRMRQVLQEKIDYPYLLDNAQSRLNAARNLAQREGLTSSPIFGIEENSFYWFPGLGSTAFFTLERVLKDWLKSRVEIRKIKAYSPYYFWIQLGQDTKIEDFVTSLINLLKKDLTNIDLVANYKAPKMQKYDELIPQPLLQKAWALDYVDLTSLQDENWLEDLRSSSQ
ncbi:MAG: ATP-dependent helicase, partial [Spirulinaceae cyanobacterium]